MKLNIDDKLSFITVCSFIIFLGVSGARATYLYIPNIFLTHSKCYKFLSKKIKTYLSIHVVILIIAGIWCLFLGKNKADTIFVCAFFPSLIVLFAIFSIDISRYQLSAFVAIIEQFKDQHKKESA
ncbi:hypothetical protein [Arsenophonus sp.]|uniref:hypothetical protein n=1 Tax=Arsenophonus sp. TaxID=1872640 RepID=UPI003879B694